MAKAKRTAQQEFRRVAEACGWAIREQSDDYGEQAFFTRGSHSIEVSYAIDGGVKAAVVREDGQIKDLIATSERRQRVLQTLKAPPW